MCGFTITNRKISDIDFVDHYTKLRGPDETTVTHFGDITVVHHLLSLTGEYRRQPFESDGIVCVFNGEIYNYKEFGNYQSDGDCLIPLYREYGRDFTSHLDGEYAIVIIDMNIKQVYAYRDVFGIKPCYIATEGNDFAISSYASSIQRLGFEQYKMPSKSSHEFSLIQFKDTFDDWIEAFERAVAKRLSDRPMFIGLSSGFDSGAIDCALKKHRAKYTAITIGNEYIEGRESLRFPLPEHPRSIDISSVDQLCDYNIAKDIASYGQALLFKTAKEMGFKLCLSGQGADEVMWGYDKENFASNVQTLGKDFYEKRQKWFLEKEERIAGAHGIESRYPFLDIDVVQEYLWLKPELKNMYYKAPIHEYLTRNNYPFEPGVKRGFGMGMKGEKYVKEIPKENSRYKLFQKLSKIK